MGKYLLFVIFVLMAFVNSCANGEQLPKSLGIGFLNINIENSKLFIYAKPDDKTLIDEILIKQSKDGSWVFKSKINLEPAIIFEGSTYEEGRENTEMGLIPFPPELRFRVLGIEKNYFKVVVDEEKWQIYYIKDKDNAMTYLTWEDFLKTVEFIELDPIKIYNNIDGKVILSLDTTECYPFNATKVQGDWIEIEQHPLYTYDKKIPKTGWAKWKDNNKLLINIIEGTYE